MGLTGSTLEIGRSALLAYQSALQVIGNNISNTGSPGYTRQTPVLSPATGVPLPEGFTPGGGVMLSGLKRNIDDALENRIRIAIGDQSSTEVQQQTLGRIEGILGELSDSDISSLMQKLFNAFGSLENQPHDLSTRGIVLSAAQSLAAEIRRQRGDTLELTTEINKELATDAKQADKILHDIADLNVQITAVESAQSGGANSLRDQRDSLLRQLGELMQIQVREQPDGGLNVYVNNELLVQGGYTRGITYTTETDGLQAKTIIRFADNNATLTLSGGRMAGLIATRDNDVVGQVNALDQLAAALINEVNKVHAQGQGLQGYTSLTGGNALLDANVALNSTAAGLKLRPQNGSFQITVTDRGSNASVVSTIHVDLDGAGADDSLTSLAAAINAQVSNVTATVTADNRLQLTAANGFDITFGQDSSNVLAALGVNTLFTGTDASSIDVSAALLADPRLLAAATQRSAGDGSNAGRLSALATASLDSLSGQSITDYYQGIVANIANKGAASKASAEATGAIATSLTAQRESISGVNLDEETISLMQMERAFQGAAHFTTVVDKLIEEMLAIVR